MNYESIYHALIESRKIRIKESNIHYEVHHIIPKCLGGDVKYIVYLTYREHFMAHKLLFLFQTGIAKQKMGYALHRMCTVNNGSQQYRINNGRLFEKVKTEIYEYIKGPNHPSYGIKYSAEFRKNISDRMKKEGNPQYGKKSWNNGLTKEINDSLKKSGDKISLKHKTGELNTIGMVKYNKSEVARLKMSKRIKGKPKSVEHRKRLSDANKGKSPSFETRKLMSIARKGVPQKKITCPHCNKQGGTTMYRWHFENCKLK